MSARLACGLIFVGLCAAVTACSDSGTSVTGAGGKSSKPSGGSGGEDAGSGGNGANAGGAQNAGGAGQTAVAGSAGLATPVCVNSEKWQGVLKKPNPLVSIGKPVTTNSADTANKGRLNDGVYSGSVNGFAMTPTEAGPTWAAINVGAGYSKLLLSWRTYGYEDFGPSLYQLTDYRTALVPSGYLVKTSGDSTDGSDGTWTTVATVTGNEARSRSHVVEFTGQAWVRFEVTDSPLVDSKYRAVRLDELELHDISAAGPDDKRDTWFLMGDSITKMALNRYHGANEIDKLVSKARPSYAPALVTAGIGGEALTDALRHLKTEDWLKYSEGLDFVTLAYGTNDSWGSGTPESKGFETTMRSIIDLLLTNGRTPVLVRIPWNQVGANLTAFNAVIDKLQKEYDLPCGPDLYSWFQGHQSEIKSATDPHPTATGETSINQQYAAALVPLYQSP